MANTDSGSSAIVAVVAVVVIGVVGYFAVQQLQSMNNADDNGANIEVSLPGGENSSAQ